MTATEADINASEQNAKLTSIADNLEGAFKRLVNYCLMFEGGISVDAVMNTDAIEIDLPRDFATPKLSVEEIAKLIEFRMMGAMSPQAFKEAVEKGGWPSLGDEAELEEMPPMVRVNSNNPADS